MLFSEVLHAMHAGDGGWDFTFPEDWLQGRSAFGGLQAALGVRAMRALVPQELPLRSLQTSFIAPVAGSIRIEARLLRAGKSAIQVEARLLLADGSVGCLLLGIFGASRESAIAIAPPPPTVARDVEQSRELRYTPGRSPVFAQYLRMRWADGGFPYSGAAEPRTQVHLCFPDEPIIDDYLLIALADTIPSPGLSLLKKWAIASSLTWTLEFLRHDYDPAATAWWLMDAEVTAASDGYLNQTATLWSPDGKAVALSRQTVVAFG